jgi:aryl-alcohol dehydrogenase-like predicted oxidoreductase
MLTRQLGNDGPEVSVLGVGCNSFGLRTGRGETHDIVATALDEGVTFFDTADIYGKTESERFLGEALGARRDDVVLATKWGLTMEGAPEKRARGLRKREVPRGSAEYIRWALEGSLQRLGTDRIDLYQYHRYDGETPLEETFAVLNELVREGKIRWVGLSKVEVPWLERAAALAKEMSVPLITVQHRYSLVHREPERELLPACARLGLSVLPNYPLEGGLLSGKYQRGVPPPADSRFASMQAHWPQEEWLTAEAFDRVAALEKYASEREISLLEVAIGGLAAMPAVGSVIAGATRPEQVRANARAARWTPSAGDVEALKALA